MLRLCRDSGGITQSWGPVSSSSARLICLIFDRTTGRHASAPGEELIPGVRRRTLSVPPGLD